MRLLLVRHGETDWLAEGRLQGNSAVPLNERGQEQARLAARTVKMIRPDRIFSSTLPRAQETADFMAAECGRRREDDGRLNEISFGDWEGKHHEEIQAQYPVLYQDWLDLKADFVPPAGESVREVSGRMRNFFDQMRVSSETLVAVSHGGPIRLLFLELLGAPLGLFRSVPLPPCSMFLIEAVRGGVRVMNVNADTGAPAALWRLGEGALETADLEARA
jgi:broad specificity phosphatase PhoE